MTYVTIRNEGGLLSADFLEILPDQAGQQPVDFGLDRRRSLVDEITATWSDVRAYWTAFQRRVARSQQSQSESLTTITREQWVIPLLEALGYQVSFQRRAVEIDGRTYALSHRAERWNDERGTMNDAGRGQRAEGRNDERGTMNDAGRGQRAEGRNDERRTMNDEGREQRAQGGPPVHIVSFEQALGSRPGGGRGTASPHALMQDYLNRSEDLWGVVTNGAVLRLLRDSSYFSRPAYVEFDLQGMLEGERLDEFILLYRLAHRSRLPASSGEASACLLESYHQQTLEQGGRIRDGLRAAVEQAIVTLANGFLRHPKNDTLRSRISSGQLSAEGLYQQLLYVIYRLLFLMVAEERNLLVGEGGRQVDKGKVDKGKVDREGSDLVYLSTSPLSTYYQHYSLARLRRLAEALAYQSAPQRFDDLYLGLRTLFQVVREEQWAPLLGLPVLNGQLFSLHHTRDLDAAYLNNQDLLQAVGLLSSFSTDDERVRRRVNYAALDVEELGSVYESLLDEYPVVTEKGRRGEGAGRLTFDFVAGTERKTTGSYYTARELVKEVIDSTLAPVIDERLAAADRDGQAHAQERALLALRVCDKACGSGHFLLAAARRIGRALAQVRTGDEEPAPEAVREATRDAITHCIYGVDKNPLAVDLCKVALWIEGHSLGKPLTFLDYRIRCGDSLVGVFDLDVLDEGIPDDAYKPVTGDDKAVASALRKRNKEERAGQAGMDMADRPAQAAAVASEQWQALVAMPEDTPAQARQKQAAYDKLLDQEQPDLLACHLWTAAFFTPLTRENLAQSRIPTSDALRRYRANPRSVDARLLASAQALAAQHRFFHWPLAFPEVFAQGGFDVVVGNPPWERIKLQEQEFFATRDPEIASAPNKAARQRLIDGLPKSNPALAAEFQWAKHAAEAASRFVRQSGRFPLTAVGDVNTYALFSELALNIRSSSGRAGIIVPTGVATDDTLKGFFGHLVENEQLVSLIGFINSRKIFPAIKDYIKFGLLTLGHAKQAEFMFMLTAVSQITDPRRRFSLTGSDFTLLNPNTRTCPTFRTKDDAELTKKIYRHSSVLIDDRRSENPWNASFMTMFHMSNDSNLFEDAPRPGLVRLYEAKMMHQYDHRFGTYENATPQNINEGNLPQFTSEMHADPNHLALPLYWIPRSAVDSRLQGRHASWFIGFRDITGAASERTAIFSVVPRLGIGNKIPLLLLEDQSCVQASALFANLNSLPFDFAARQKVGGANLNFFIVKQLPVLPPEAYASSHVVFIVARVLELVYTAWDIKAFADDIWREADDDLRALLRKQWAANEMATGGHAWDPPAWVEIAEDGIPLPPFKWDDERRAYLRADLDAYYARLYGLTRDELRYILDPADVYGPDFPGETFRVLKEKEIRQLGEYRTQRLVLAAWDRLERELGPVVVRNYREEMEAEGRSQRSEVRSQRSEQIPVVKAAPAGRAEQPAGRQTASRSAGAPIPVMAAPQGSYSEKLSRIMALKRQATPEAIGEMVAALGDGDANIRWLAASTLESLKDARVLEAVRVFGERTESVDVKNEVEKLLSRLT